MKREKELSDDIAGQSVFWAVLLHMYLEKFQR